MGHIVYGSIYMKYQEQEGWRWKKWEVITNRYEVSFGGHENVLELIVMMVANLANILHTTELFI